MPLYIGTCNLMVLKDINIWSKYVTLIQYICLISVKPFAQTAYPTGKPATAVSAGDVGPLQTAPPPVWEGRAIATHKLRLVEFSAFMESQSREEAVSF